MLDNSAQSIDPVIAHELGHSIGLQNGNNTADGNSIMDGFGGDCDMVQDSVQPNDVSASNQSFEAPTACEASVSGTPAPAPTPNCTDNDGDGYGSGTGCLGGDCDDSDASVVVCGGGGSDPNHCGGDCQLRCLEVGAYCDPGCNCYTPVVVDTAGDGFRLTDARDGVSFDIDGDPSTVNRLGWTEAGSDDAWLALDRDGNGRVDNGAELFGDLTPQVPSDDPNGFLALAEFDRPERGGNADGRIDARDSIFGSLRLWRDENHNGVSEAGELHPLPSLGVAGLELGYRESRRRDRHGNVFRYRAKAHGAGDTRVGRWAYDVFLVPPR